MSRKKKVKVSSQQIVDILKEIWNDEVKKEKELLHQILQWGSDGGRAHEGD